VVCNADVAMHDRSVPALADDAYHTPTYYAVAQLIASFEMVKKLA